MLVVGAVACLAVFAVNERLGSVTHYRQDESSMGRITIWSHSLRGARNPFNLIMGRGYGSIIEQMWRSRSAHSSYMNNLFELGAPGLFFLVGLLFFALRDAYALARKAIHPNTRILALALTGMMAGIILGSAVETLSYRIYVLIPVAMISSLRLIEQRERAAAMPAGTIAGAGPDDDFLQPFATQGFGLAERRLVTKKDFKLVAFFTFGCWLAYTVLVAIS